MTKLIHSIPWTLALSLAAQAGEGEVVRIPDVSTGSRQESPLDASADSALDSGNPESALGGASDVNPEAPPLPA